MCNNCGCGNTDSCCDDQEHGKHGHGMNCCEDHVTTREHLEMKKKMLEDQLAQINEVLGKSE